VSEEEEQVGSATEEAAKLLGALQDWAKQHGYDSATAGAAGAPSMFHNLNEHIATGGEECRYCPLCQTISLVRQTSPEVKQHLTSAATSLLKAVVAAMPAQPNGDAHGRTRDPVEKIDLSDEPWND
jgi:hypothetical protein